MPKTLIYPLLDDYTMGSFDLQHSEANRVKLAEMIDQETIPNFEPGSFGFHEALHTTSVVTDMFGDHIWNHPAVVLNPALFRRAEAILHGLFELYQYLGSLDDDDNNEAADGDNPEEGTGTDTGGGTTTH